MTDPIKEIEDNDKPVDDKPIDDASADDKSDGNVLKVLNDIKDSLQKPGAPAPTRAEIREAMKDQTGFTDKQIDLVEQMQQAVVKANNSKVAVLEGKVAWNEFKDEVGGKIDPTVEKMMKEELKQYEPEMHGDKILLKKIYFMSLGIQVDKMNKQRKNDPSDKPNDAENIVGRTIVNDNKGSAQGLENDGTNGSKGKDLSNDEKVMAKNMNISEAEYARSKSTKIVSQLKGAVK